MTLWDCKHKGSQAYLLGVLPRFCSPGDQLRGQTGLTLSEDSMGLGRVCTTPLVPSYDNLVTDLSISPKGKRTLARDVLPPSQPKQDLNIPLSTCPAASLEFRGPHFPATTDTRTYFVWIVKQQHLRDHCWRHQRTESRKLGAGCWL